MKQYGNIKSNQIYHPDERRHPPPTNMMESERDSELEKFIRGSFFFVCYTLPCHEFDIVM
jgi:stromal membrane-associated protein